MNKVKIPVIISFLLVIGCQSIEAQKYAENGMIVSSSEIASEVGVEILKKGGNSRWRGSVTRVLLEEQKT